MITKLFEFFSSWKLILVLVGLVSIGGVYAQAYHAGKQKGSELAIIQCEAQKAEAYKQARDKLVKDLAYNEKQKRKTKALSDAALDAALSEWMRDCSGSASGK